MDTIHKIIREHITNMVTSAEPFTESILEAELRINVGEELKR